MQVTVGLLSVCDMQIMHAMHAGLLNYGNYNKTDEFLTLFIYLSKKL